jgi:transcriptional regulator GlxA family with amidase domain
MSPSTRPITITFVLCQQMLTTSTTLPIEMIQAAVSSARAKDRSASKIRVQTAAVTKDGVQTRSGFVLQPEMTLAEIEETDVIYLPALWRNPRPIIHQSPELIEWIRRHYEKGCTIAAVGTGCCFLAEAGILDGKPATTHWHYFDQFQRDYPLVQLKRQYFITQAGNLYCAASVNALADLTVHFMQRLYGKAVATQVERNFSHEIRRSYESSSFLEDRPSHHPDEDIIQAQMWLQDNYGREILLKDVAARFDMSVRSFNRRFKGALGKTPLQYLQEIRIENAKDLLKTSNLSISEIAYRVGYQDMSHFTGLFKKFLAVTPSEYRTTVRAKLFSAKV